jgi:hypothetical protein
LFDPQYFGIFKNGIGASAEHPSYICPANTSAISKGQSALFAKLLGRNAPLSPIMLRSLNFAFSPNQYNPLNVCNGSQLTDRKAQENHGRIMQLP